MNKLQGSCREWRILIWTSGAAEGYKMSSCIPPVLLEQLAMKDQFSVVLEVCAFTYQQSWECKVQVWCSE